MSFKFMATLSAIIAGSLTLMYGVLPGLVYWIFNIADGGPVSNFLSRRVAVLFLGFSVLLWVMREAKHSLTRNAVCLGVAIMTGAFAFLGLAEIIRGFAGGLTWGVVALEFFLMVGFARIWLANK